MGRLAFASSRMFEDDDWIKKAWGYVEIEIVQPDPETSPLGARYCVLWTGDKVHEEGKNLCPSHRYCGSAFELYAHLHDMLVRLLPHEPMSKDQLLEQMPAYLFDKLSEQDEEVRAFWTEAESHRYVRDDGGIFYRRKEEKL